MKFIHLYKSTSFTYLTLIARLLGNDVANINGVHSTQNTKASITWSNVDSPWFRYGAWAICSGWWHCVRAAVDGYTKEWRVWVFETGEVQCIWCHICTIIRFSASSALATHSFAKQCFFITGHVTSCRCLCWWISQHVPGTQHVIPPPIPHSWWHIPPPPFFSLFPSSHT